MCVNEYHVANKVFSWLQDTKQSYWNGRHLVSVHDPPVFLFIFHYSLHLPYSPIALRRRWFPYLFSVFPWSFCFPSVPLIQLPLYGDQASQFYPSATTHRQLPPPRVTDTCSLVYLSYFDCISSDWYHVGNDFVFLFMRPCQKTINFVYQCPTRQTWPAGYAKKI